MRFGKNNVLGPKYIDIYEFWGVWGDIHIPPYIFGLLFKKNEKVPEYDLYQNQIICHFDLIFFFPRMNNKKITKRFSLILFLYELSIVVLIDFMAILLIPGIFLI